MKKNECTWINHVFDKKSNEIKRISFEDLVDIYNLEDDREFVLKLKEMGYTTKLKQLKRSAKYDVTNRNWPWIKRNPSILAYYLLNLEFHEVLSCLEEDNRQLSNSDLRPIEGLPANFVDDLKTTRYDLIKMLYPLFSFVTFKEGNGKNEAFVQSHSGLMALDIDIKYDDENEVLETLRKHVDIYCVLSSPSGSIRPVIRIDVSDEKMIQITKWQHSEVSKADLSRKLPRLYKTYMKVIFDKLKKQLENETIMVEGESVQFTLDPSCKNVNRFWYIARNKGRKIVINYDVKPVGITRGDCIRFSKKIFSPYDDILAGL